MMKQLLSTGLLAVLLCGCQYLGFTNAEAEKTAKPAETAKPAKPAAKPAAKSVDVDIDIEVE